MINTNPQKDPNSNYRVSKRSKALRALGLLALLGFISTFSISCSSSSPKSEGAIEASDSSAADAATPSTTSSGGEVTADQQATPTSVAATQQGAPGDRSSGITTPQAAQASPNPQAPAPTQPPVITSPPPVITSPPPVITSPPTTAYVCVPNSGQISRLNSDYSYSQSQYTSAYSSLISRNLGRSGMMVTLQATAAENQTEYNRALSALNNCESTSWYFDSY
jgi:hypothetical protein